MTRCLTTLFIAMWLLTACGGGQSATAVATPEPTNTPPPTDTPTPAPTATPLPTATVTLVPSPTATATPVPPTATTTAVPATATPTEIATQIDKNIAYMPDGHAKQKLDIYRPGSSTGPFPTLLMIHGGYGDKRDMAAWARYFADRGYAVISINHRELPQDTYPAPVEDAFCALAWAHANAQEYGFDPQHVFVLGHSAGGTLAAMLGTVDDPARFLQDCPYSLPESDWVHAIIPFTGIFDYAQAASDSIGLRQYNVEYLGAEPDDAPDLWAEASPLTWVDGNEPPFLLVHGLDDESIPPDQSKEFAAALTKAGVEAELWLVPRADHMAIIRDQKSYEAVETFLAEMIP